MYEYSRQSLQHDTIQLRDIVCLLLFPTILRLLHYPYSFLQTLRGEDGSIDYGRPAGARALHRSCLYIRGDIPDAHSRARVNGNAVARAESHGDERHRLKEKRTRERKREKEKEGEGTRERLYEGGWLWRRWWWCWCWWSGCGGVECAVRVVDGVQVREQYISVTRRRVIKGGVAGGSG